MVNESMKSNGSRAHARVLFTFVVATTIVLFQILPRNSRLVRGSHGIFDVNHQQQRQLQSDNTTIITNSTESNSTSTNSTNTTIITNTTDSNSTSTNTTNTTIITNTTSGNSTIINNSTNGNSTDSNTTIVNTTSTFNCSIPKFVGPWEEIPRAPRFLGESQGGIIGDDFVLISGFTRTFNSTPLSRQVYALNITTSDIQSAKWRTSDDIPVTVGLTHGAFVSVGPNFYICGGYLGMHPGPATNECWVYRHTNPNGTRWSNTTIPPLPEARAGGALLHNNISNSLIFATGAARPDPSNLIHTVDRNDVWELSLDNISAGWLNTTSLPYMGNHIGYKTMIYNETQRLFVMGGQRGENEASGNLNDMYEYDPMSLSWTARQNLTSKRGHFSSSVVAYNGCGFLIAGGTINDKGKTADISYYDIGANKWTSIGTLPAKINTPVCDIAGGYLYCISGHVLSKFSFRRKIE